MARNHDERRREEDKGKVEKKRLCGPEVQKIPETIPVFVFQEELIDGWRHRFFYKAVPSLLKLVSFYVCGIAWRPCEEIQGDVGKWLCLGDVILA